MEKKLNIVLALNSIYQKRKTESVYLILKNNYGPFSETRETIDNIMLVILFMPSL